MKYDLTSLDFVINRFFMKPFRNCKYIPSQFLFDLPTTIGKRAKTFKESLDISRLYIPSPLIAALSHLSLSIASFKCTTHLEGIHAHILHWWESEIWFSWSSRLCHAIFHSCIGERYHYPSISPVDNLNTGVRAAHLLSVINLTETLYRSLLGGDSNVRQSSYLCVLNCSKRRDECDWIQRRRQWYVRW